MNMPTSTGNTYGPSATPLEDKIGHAADGAARSTHQAVDQAADSITNKVEDLRSQAAPLIDRVSAQAEAAARRGIEAMRGSSQQLRDKAARATDSTVAYVKDEPVKAMLIAAATGAALMALVSLMGRSRND
jgi:ElaB/YqjD/DUF883 family membrane-anchored ribosome-binding protein